MLKSASLSNFTSVPSDKWNFSSGLNVIIGENGLGKSHVLKALYSSLKALTQDSTSLEGISLEKLGKIQTEKRIADELIGNLRPDTLGRLVKRQQGRNKSEISIKFNKNEFNIDFSFATNSRSQVEITRMPAGHIMKTPVFIPTRELITLCPWFVALFDTYNVPFENNWRDTVSLLGAPSLKGPREAKVKEFLLPIEQAMGGKVEVDANGRFFLKVNGGRMEAGLVAEGLRKFAMLARLISTGVLLEQGYLFWDEPETNLNPKLIKVLARVIVGLADQGIQVFVATHSTFLLREIALLTDGKSNRKNSRYFGLVASGDDDVSILEQGDSIEEIETLVLIDEELAQSDRYLDIQADG
ncbi:AAA family ATPase [Stakelama pacifica]|uniref:Putative ATPase n=1 Tax=Stakelama pacifica TaxID=517720 RepID=A0A4R6FB87_9SPHN|nr:ATP-binding protein [Stakelama pacifica]TDN77820.1 putative ATPase [Stakelama pacifica]GGP00718.1 ATP-binding protein [Stakelama pacifica]